MEVNSNSTNYYSHGIKLRALRYKHCQLWNDGRLLAQHSSVVMFIENMLLNFLGFL